MSALELYALSPYAEYSYTPLFLTIAVIAFVSLIQIHLLYKAELDKYSVAFDKRLAALESATKGFTARESAHDKLLEEHGEEISLAAETAYRAAGLPSTNNPHPMCRFVPFHSSAQYVLDEPILKFLCTSPKKTVREILSHLLQDEATQTEWKRHTGPSIITHHDLNSRLYCLLAVGKLKKDNGARPLWSAI
jgi:hypothetical protein